MNISKISLGTAQFGMQYGVANHTMPTKKNVTKILEYALNHGISSFDTAQVYGNSEKILGQFLKKTKKTTTVISKIPKITFKQRHPDFHDVYDSIKKSVIVSTKNLEIKKLPICLLHNPSDLDRYDGLIEKSLVRLKKEKIVNKIGISAYTSKEIKRFLEIKKLDVIQVPLNILDTRLMKNGLLEELSTENNLVFVRSLFLQGLVFLNPNKLPKNLLGFSTNLKKIKKICEENNFSVQQLALLFVRDLEEITSLIVGVDTISQLKQNIKLLSMPPLPTNVNEEILKIKTLSEKLLNPSNW